MIIHHPQSRSRVAIFAQGYRAVSLDRAFGLRKRGVSGMTRIAMALISAFALFALASSVSTAHAQAQPAQAVAAPMAYGDSAPDYRFFPGDQIEITVFSAPELSRTV